MRVSGSDRVPLLLRFFLDQRKSRQSRNQIPRRDARRPFVELSSRVFGHANDEINIEEEVILVGKLSRELVKIGVALEDHTRRRSRE